MSELYIFPDTNLFMHFVRPDQIDWCALSGASRVILTVSPTVLAELDKHKNQHPIRRLKDRARETVGWFRTLADGHEIRPGVTIAFLVREPVAADFADGLDRGVPDDRLIASVLERAAAGGPVAVATDDTLLSLKVRSRQITWIEVPEVHRLKEEPDPLEAENAQLRRQNRALINRQPKLALVWTEGGAKDLALTARSGDVDRPKTPYEMRALHRPMAGGHRERTPDDPFEKFALGLLPSEADIKTYNKELDEFYVEYDKYYVDQTVWCERFGRILKLEFSLHNRGTSSANDVTVTVKLPTRLTLVNFNKEERPPNPPHPPVRPQFGMSAQFAKALRGGAFGLGGGSGGVPSSLFEPSFPDLIGRPILDLNDNSVQFNLPKLQHGFVNDLRPVYALHDPALVGSAAALDVEIAADELPAALTVKLVLKLANWRG